METTPGQHLQDRLESNTPDEKDVLEQEAEQDAQEQEEPDTHTNDTNTNAATGIPVSEAPLDEKVEKVDGRKRPRNSMGVNNTMKAKAAADFRGAIQDLYSDNTEKMASAINVVLIRTYDDSNPVNLEEIPELLPALSHLLDLFNPVGSLIYKGKPSMTNEELIYTKFHESPWPDRIKTEYDDYFMIVSRSLQENKLMEYICTILQNLSFEQSNEAIIVFNASILRHLISLLYVDASTGKHGEMYRIVELSYGVLSRCARFLDATGARRVESDLFLVDGIDGKVINSMGVTTIPLISSSRDNPQHAYIKSEHQMLFGGKNSERYKEFFGEASTPMVVELIRGVFPLLLHKMYSLDRTTALFSLELISRLAMCTENEKIFRAAPDSLYKKLVELLYVTNVGTDPFELASQIHPASDMLNMGQGALTDVVGFNGVENKKLPVCTMPITELVDLEMRDYALDAMHNLCLLNPEYMSVRMGRMPHCIPYLKKIIETPAPATVKSEMNIPQKASSILNFMIVEDALRDRLKSMERDFIIGASNDSVMAEFVSGPTLKLFFDDYDPPETSPAFPMSGGMVLQNVGGDHQPRRGGNGSNQYVRRVSVAGAGDGVGVGVEKDNLSAPQPRLTLKLSMGNKRDRTALENDQ